MEFRQTLAMCDKVYNPDLCNVTCGVFGCGCLLGLSRKAGPFSWFVKAVHYTCNHMEIVVLELLLTSGDPSGCVFW